MRIAINGSFLIKQGGGIKEYIVNLVNSLINNNIYNYEFILYVPRDIDKGLLEQIPVSEYLKIKSTPYKSTQRIWRSLTEGYFWRKEEKIEHFNIFHSPFFHSPKLKRAKIVLTVHDLRFLRYPDTYELLRYIFLKYKVKRSINHADHIITISNFTKEELQKFFNKSENDINVIHNGLNTNQFSEKSIPSNFQPPYNLINKDYLLYVSHLEPRKNHINLIESFNELVKNDSYKDLFLVLVGKVSHGSNQVINAINKNDKIIYLSFVESEFLYWLYSNARLFVFPSLYEGFGFPPLEAAAFNLVSAVSNKSSIPEVCSDSVFYFDPNNINDMVKTFDLALSDFELYKEKKEKVAKNLKRFSWDDNAQKVFKVYKKVDNEH